MDLASSISSFLTFVFLSIGQGANICCSNCTVTSEVKAINALNVFYDCEANCNPADGCAFIRAVEAVSDTANRVVMNVSWSPPLDGSKPDRVSVRFSPVDTRYVSGNTGHCRPDQPSYTWCFRNDLLLNVEYFIRLIYELDSPRCTDIKPLCIKVESGYDNTSPTTPPSGSRSSRPTVVPHVSTDSDESRHTTSEHIGTHPVSATGSYSTTGTPLLNGSVVSTSGSYPSALPAESTTAGILHRNQTESASVTAVIIVINVLVFIVLAVVTTVVCRYKLKAIKCCSVKTRDNLPDCLEKQGQQFTAISHPYDNLTNGNAISNKCLEETNLTRSSDISNRHVTVWLSHPTQWPATRTAARKLAEKLMSCGIVCKSYLICHTEIAIHGLQFVQKLMDCVDIILVCCSQEYIQACSWEGTRDESCGSGAFFYEYLKIHNELRQERYKRLAVVLLDTESTDCIPECLRHTVNYKVRDDNGFFDLLHRIGETEPNALQANEEEREYLSLMDGELQLHDDHINGDTNAGETAV